MPRHARTLSSTGIYHVMLRGIDRQRIFEDVEDNEKFLAILKDCKAIGGFGLYAYCLMGNHLHLLIKVGKEPLEQVFRRIGSRYVYWYNAKYSRAGHLFQDRYKSEAVENDGYFLTTVRYIHQNPVKAGLVKSPGDYPYSSYCSYVGKAPRGIVDTGFVMRMLSRLEFIMYHEQNSGDACLEVSEQPIRLTDEQAMQKIAEITKCQSTAELQQLDTGIKNEYISMLRASGLSVRQISRLIGASKGIVERCGRT